MNLYQGLLFLHGHFTRPDDLEPTCAPAPVPAAGLGAALRSLVLLGGRPMHPNRPYDVEEPLELPELDAGTAAGRC
ncbi:MAG TPA: hypothetical protein VEY50_02040 [Lysobacter sp.]|nr:hypothetical protein [Lysobacter sp.]